MMGILVILLLVALCVGIYFLAVEKKPPPRVVRYHFNDIESLNGYWWAAGRFAGGAGQDLCIPEIFVIYQEEDGSLAMAIFLADWKKGVVNWKDKIKTSVYNLGGGGRIITPSTRFEVRQKSFHKIDKKFIAGGKGEGGRYDYNRRDENGAIIILTDEDGSIVTLLEFPFMNGDIEAANVLAHIRRTITELTNEMIANGLDTPLTPATNPLDNESFNL